MRAGNPLEGYCWFNQTEEAPGRLYAEGSVRLDPASRQYPRTVIDVSPTRLSLGGVLRTTTGCGLGVSAELCSSCIMYEENAKGPKRFGPVTGKPFTITIGPGDTEFHKNYAIDEGPAAGTRYTYSLRWVLTFTPVKPP